jgi:uncharacterized protein YndB with AHSA1/START domain
MPGTKANYSVFIEASPEDVFSYVSDLTKHGEWAADPLKIEAVDDAEIGVGKAYRSEVEFRGNMVTGEEVVTEYEPTRRFAFHVKDSTSEHDHQFTFVPQGEGTLMLRSARGQWSFGTWLLAATIGGIMIGKPATKKAFARLKEKLEG